MIPVLSSVLPPVLLTDAYGTWPWCCFCDCHSMPPLGRYRREHSILLVLTVYMKWLTCFVGISVPTDFWRYNSDVLHYLYYRYWCYWLPAYCSSFILPPYWQRWWWRRYDCYNWKATAPFTGDDEGICWYTCLSYLTLCYDLRYAIYSDSDGSAALLVFYCCWWPWIITEQWFIVLPTGIIDIADADILADDDCCVLKRWHCIREHSRCCWPSQIPGDSPWPDAGTPLRHY